MFSILSLLLSGIKDFHFVPLVKNIKARVTTLSKQTNQPTKKERANWTNKQTDESKLTFLNVIASQLPVQLRPSPLNPNKQVHTKDPFVFWQVAFRWQSWVFFWHSSISKKMGKKRKILQRKWFHESDNTFIFNFYKMKKHYVSYHCDKWIVNLN